MKNNKAKRIYIILLINVVFLVFIIILFNRFIEISMKPENFDKSIFYINIHQNIDSSKINIDKYETEQNRVINIELTDESLEKFCGEKRIKFGEEYKKSPIIMLGCSYAYGHGLKREQTFSYLLSNITKRPIYNFSNCGGCMWQSIDDIIALDQKDLDRLKNSDYVIYVYMHDHINRYLSLNHIYELYEYLIEPKPNFIIKNILKIPVFRFLFISSNIYNIVNKGRNEKNINLFVENSSAYLKKIIMKSYHHIKTIAPNAKFIIIVYDEKLPADEDNLTIKYDSEILNSHIWKELENETDITIVHTKDITGFLFDKDYKLKQDIANWHPNEKAWQVFTPKFAKNYIN